MSAWSQPIYVGFSKYLDTSRGVEGEGGGGVLSPLIH